MPFKTVGECANPVLPRKTLNAGDFSELRDYQWGNLTTGTQLNANSFGSNKFISVPDPQCGVITTNQSLNRAVTATHASQDIGRIRCKLVLFPC